VRQLSLSIGLMNAATCWLGHFPSCHGCGGLAAQHLYGARTGSSMALMGLLKMALALLFGLGSGLGVRVRVRVRVRVGVS